VSEPTAGSAGTPTFLFTDIEGSTRLLRQLGERYSALLDEHRELIGNAVVAAGGRVFGREGDAVFSSFPTAAGGLAAAADAQRALERHDWPTDGRIRVRMGVHSGEAMESRGDYVGLAVHQVARIMSAGHGGQVLVSEATRRLISTLPAGTELRDLGERRLKDLAAPERLYQLVIEGLDDRFPALRTLDTHANNLPVQLTSFVGRAELATARDALSATRLLTLSGPGGTGKTRLALQLAADVSGDFEDGVFFVPLDTITSAELVPSAIASALGLSVTGTAPPLDAVIEFLRDKHMVLLLDNFEQVVEAAADVGRLLREVPGIKVIVTTRVVLRAYGERELPVPPLGLPPAGDGVLSAEQAAAFEAVELFVERARAVQPAFVLTDENAPLVVDICRRLDGLPLAIELAAARTRALPVAAIHARLDQHLSLLTGGSRDLPGRQQTLRGAIDWSYDLLEVPDRRLFERFSIHSGGAFLTQAESVCGPSTELGEDVLDGLSSLADKSLVKPDLSAAEDPRFAMLVTIRDYAHERLEGASDFEALARRHAHVYLALAESLAPGLTGPDSRATSDRFEADTDNIRAAIDWSVTATETELAMRLVIATWRFWQRRGHLDEARRRVDAVLSMPGVSLQSDELQARAFLAAGSVTYWQADVHQTFNYYERAVEAARGSGNRRLIAEALYNHGFAAEDDVKLSDELYVKGVPFWEESLSIYRELGDAQGIADVAWGLAQAEAALGSEEHAIAYGEQALAGYREINDSFGAGWALYVLAGLHVRYGRLDVAEKLVRESTHIFVEANDLTGILMNLAAFLVFAQRHGQKLRELRLAGATVKLRASTGAGLLDAPIDVIQFVLPTQPESPEEQREFEIGGRMSAQEAAHYALADMDADKSELSAE
jgi:predicted ATPase/class 3 adenylate cyclase